MLIIIIIYIDQNYLIKTEILWNSYTIENNSFLFEYILKCMIPVMRSWIFSIITSASRDPSEI